MFEHAFYQKEEIKVLEKFDTALEQLDNILGENDKLLALFLRSTLYLRLGEVELGKRLANELLERSRRARNKMREFDAINNLLLAHRMNGNFDEAFDLAENEEELIEKLSKSQNFEFVRKKSIFYYEIGLLHYANSRNNLGPAHDYCLKSYSLSETIHDKEQMAKSLGSLGYFLLSKGELNQALDYFEKSFPLLEGIENKQIPATIMNSVGITNLTKGEMATGLEFFKKSLSIYEEIGSHFNVSRVLNNIGCTYCMMGDLVSGKEFLEKSLSVSRKTQEHGMRIEVLYNMIKYFVKDLPSDQRESILEEMETSFHTVSFPVNKQKVPLARAIVLKMSDRLTDKAVAQTIFRDISEQEIVWYELTIDALLNLGELLVFELKSTANEDVFNELKRVIDRLLGIARSQSSHWLLTEIYLLQSRLSLLELDIDKAEQLLTQAELLAIEKGFKKLSYSISLEKEALARNLNKWKKIIEIEPSISERIELTQFNTLFERFLMKKLYRSDEEIKKYVSSAQQIVENWE